MTLATRHAVFLAVAGVGVVIVVPTLRN